MDGALAHFFFFLLKVKIIKIPSTYLLEKINKNYDRKKLFGYHDIWYFTQKLSKVEIIWIPFIYILEKINKNYDRK